MRVNSGDEGAPEVRRPGCLGFIRGGLRREVSCGKFLAVFGVENMIEGWGRGRVVREVHPL